MFPIVHGPRHDDLAAELLGLRERRGNVLRLDVERDPRPGARIRDADPARDAALLAGVHEAVLERIVLAER